MTRSATAPLRAARPTPRPSLQASALPLLMAASLVLWTAPGSAQAQEDLICPTASSPMPTPRPLDLSRMRFAANAAGPFSIALHAGPGLRANPAALAAFQHAAARWEAVLTDPIQVNLDVDFGSIEDPGVIGQTESVLLTAPFDLFLEILRLDASDEAADSIVASLPDLASFMSTLPAGVPFSDVIVFTKANLKAIGIDADDLEGPLDGIITINSAVTDFDFDRSDGIAPGRVDFEGVAVHEIGHALGFLSLVDAFPPEEVDEAFATTFDLFRFTAGGDPDSPAEFARLARRLVPGGDAVFDDAVHELRLSTGDSGDGRQAGHWKDDVLTRGIVLGVMDPTVARGQPMEITAADRRALDLIGYEAQTAEALPSVTVNGPLRVNNGGSVRLRSQISDQDGLGFPIFAGLGVTGRVRLVWSFSGGTGLESNAIFRENPLVSFQLPPGGRTTVFRPTVTAFDFLGDQASAQVEVTVSDPPSVTLTANGQAVPSIQVPAGATVQLAADAQDDDGLGFPIFSAFGVDAPIAFVWDFGGGSIAAPLLIFSPSPTATFAGSPGDTFDVSVIVFDGVGLFTQRSVRIELAP